MKFVNARADVLRARTLGDSEYADAICGRFEEVVKVAHIGSVRRAVETFRAQDAQQR